MLCVIDLLISYSSGGEKYCSRAGCSRMQAGGIFGSDLDTQPAIYTGVILSTMRKQARSAE